MLTELYLSNYLFVPQARISFGRGMTVLTGETGAGKSILVGAIALIFGDTQQTIEAFDPAHNVYLEATFDLSGCNEVADFLSELGYEGLDELILAREFILKGKSQYFLNGRKVAASVVKDLKPLLIDFHHQRDQQKLLSSSYQLDLLDKYGNLNDEVNSFRSDYLQLRNDLDSLAEMKQRKSDEERLHELYAFQYHELANANLSLDEDAHLQQEYDLNSAAEEIIVLGEELQGILYANENSCFDQLGKAIRELSRYTHLHFTLRDIENNLTASLDLLQSSASMLRGVKNLVSYDPHALQDLRERIDVLNSLKYKHKVKDCNALVQIRDDLAERLSHAQNLDSKIQELEDTCESRYQQLRTNCDRLSSKRQQVALSMATELQGHVRNLSIPDARLEIQIDKKTTDKKFRSEYVDAISEKGQDRIDYMFSANLGSALKPLVAVVSGGELSRILLAIKFVLSKNISPKLIILDEIDAGIGGKTAEFIAGYIKELGTVHSVLCITHLAQIAAIADSHKSLQKNVLSGKTVVDIQCLSADLRIQEIARMLSGSLSGASLEHAAELLNRMSKHKR